jgi:hypothetical protein
MEFFDLYDSSSTRYRLEMPYYELRLLFVSTELNISIVEERMKSILALVWSSARQISGHEYYASHADYEESRPAVTFPSELEFCVMEPL